LSDLLGRKTKDATALALIGFRDEHLDVRSASFNFASRNFDLSFTDGVANSIAEGIGEDWMVLEYFKHPANDPKVDQWLKSPSTNLRAGVMFAMESLITPYEGKPTQSDLERAYKRFVMMAGDPEPEVLRWVVSGLSNYKSAEAIALMLEIAEKSDDEVLWYVINTFADVPGERATNLLKRAASSADRDLRSRAKAALKRREG
jgi:hypothetical protein